MDTNEHYEEDVGTVQADYIDDLVAKDKQSRANANQALQDLLEGRARKDAQRFCKQDTSNATLKKLHDYKVSDREFGEDPAKTRKNLYIATLKAHLDKRK